MQQIALYATEDGKISYGSVDFLLPKGKKLRTANPDIDAFDSRRGEQVLVMIHDGCIFCKYKAANLLAGIICNMACCVVKLEVGDYKEAHRSAVQVLRRAMEISREELLKLENQAKEPEIKSFITYEEVFETLIHVVEVCKGISSALSVNNEFKLNKNIALAAIEVAEMLFNQFESVREFAKEKYPYSYKSMLNSMDSTSVNGCLILLKERIPF